MNHGRPLNATSRPDPNDEVERWKDAVYEDTKDMNESDLARYFATSARSVMEKYGIKQATP